MISRWIKWVFFVFILVLLPVNWWTYGAGNILWISDITLLLAFFATVFESRFLASLAVVQGLIVESFWGIVFLVSLLFSGEWELTNYMFDPSIPLWIRCLSLFHLVLPFFLVWLLMQLGYVRRAWPIQIVFMCILLVLSWLLTEPSKNINFVFSYQKLGMNAFVYLLLESITLGFIMAITHWILLSTRRIRKFNS